MFHKTQRTLFPISFTNLIYIYISLLIIPCIIYYMANKETLNLNFEIHHIIEVISIVSTVSCIKGKLTMYRIGKIVCQRKYL